MWFLYWLYFIGVAFTIIVLYQDRPANVTYTIPGRIVAFLFSLALASVWPLLWIWVTSPRLAFRSSK